MKYLVALSFVQVAALGFLGFRVTEIDARSNNIAVLVEAYVAQSARAASERSANKPYTVDTFSGRNAAGEENLIKEIRRIFREEIAASEGRPLPSSNRRAAMNRAGKGAGAGPEESPGAAPIDTVYLKDTLHREIESYIGLGRIEPVEMADLQRKMARLPDEDRREMLTRLTQAMNAGDLQGEF